ncbi:LiaF transmembrane domain-containing protein [Erysipelothrix urinaevulpis]|uniref:LiaF transmembrane domain-containing protein n=1 Tax=Erysipelothrix urinaevulpis TaxID=2683717 RepID=UPI00135C714E|nr:hypothetical protein [Erysipelothrix urinaevulpis]
MKRKNVFWGLLILLFALTTLANGFNLFHGGPSLFRLALTALLFFFSISNLVDRNYYGIFMPLALILIINEQYLNINFETWPILLGAFLLSLAFSILFSKSKVVQFEFDSANTAYTVNGENIKIDSNFNSSSRYVQSENLRYASIENNFGSLSVFFSDVHFNENGATIKVDCNFGNVKLYLPKDIQTHNNIQASLGSVNEEIRTPVQGAQAVYLDGDVSFGKVEIFYI